MSSNLDSVNNDLTPILQKPEIIGITKKTTLSIFSSSAFAILLSLILIGSFYFLLKPKATNSARIRTKIENELDQKKFFSFKTVGKALLDDPEEASRDIAPSINRSIGTRKPVGNKSVEFQKYKSILTNTGATEASDSTTSDTAKTEDNAMVAESINIDPNFLIPEGTYIPCSLTTRFVSEVAGSIHCMISADVYSASGLVKLIERGTKAIGIYQSGNLQHGVVRMFVMWTKLITPDHKRINLVDTQVVGPLGEAGISGRVDSHFLQRVGGALMVSIVKDVIQHATQKNSKQQGSTININRYDNTKDSFTSIVEKMLENSINIPPTMYKKQGDIVGILVGRDINFSKIYKLQGYK